MLETVVPMSNPLARQNDQRYSEESLVFAAQRGDLEAFNQIVLRYQDRIYNTALRILGDEDSAEDITQNTFLSAFRYLANFRKGSLLGWLYRIVTNACYDELRRRKCHPMQPLEPDDETEDEFLPGYDFSNASLSPEKECERKESEQVVQRALSRLGADYRAVVTLVDLQEVDYQEAAQILGVPLGTLKSRLARARFRLRELINDR